MTRPMVLSRILAPLLVLAATLPLGGCAAIGALGAAATPLDAYVLTPARAEVTRGGTARHIVVEPPTTSGAIDTDRILIKPSPIQVTYLPGARWIDPAPLLVQSLLVESLQNTGAFRHVGRTTAGPFPDYTLMTEILDFQVEATGDEAFPFATRVTLGVALVREEDRTVISARRFTAERPVAVPEAIPIVAAFDATMQEIQRDAITWLATIFGIPTA